MLASKNGIFRQGERSGTVRRHAAALAFIGLFTGCSMPIEASSDSIELACSVEGASLLSPVQSDEAVCAAFKEKIDQILPHASKSVDMPRGSNWIKLNIRFSQPGIATATLTRNRGDGARKLDPLAVSVMDRPLGENEVKMLAADVAKQLSVQE